jgi:hypothetical protein
MRLAKYLFWVCLSRSACSGVRFANHAFREARARSISSGERLSLHALLDARDFSICSGVRRARDALLEARARSLGDIAAQCSGVKPCISKPPVLPHWKLAWPAQEATGWIFGHHR